MHVISETSNEALQRRQMEGFRMRLTSWLYANGPTFGCPQPSQAQAQEACDTALALCLPHDIRREGDVARIAMRALRHGPGLADQPEFDYLRGALAAQTVDPDRRVMLVKLIEMGHQPRTGPWHV